MKIHYTWTDEAPMLATCSLLPIVERFTRAAGIEIELVDISLAGRILAQFPERLTEEQRVPDGLAQLGALAQTPDANIVKLPNISASIPQLKATVRELQSHGFDLPDFPDEPASDKEKNIRDMYSVALGSSVNPVLREGNSDRRVAGPVKEYAKAHPHSMGEWSSDSKTRVAHMSQGDFFGSEQSVILPEADTLRIELVTANGTRVLKEKLPVEKGEIVDGSFLSAAALDAFLAEEIEKTKAEGVLFSLHLKATMMKVSDPILFGHAVKVFYGPVLDKHAEALKQVGFNPSNGMGDLESRIADLPREKQEEIQADIQTLYKERPGLAMVNSDKGITNLHVPSDVIIDASMPAAIRAGGKMWNRDGELQDMVAVIPDRCYAGVYRETVDFCRQNGAFDPSTMGSVANVGLMAKKAEEYGSHDKTFEIPEDGSVQVVNQAGEVLMSHQVQAGDIWRGCQTKDVAVRDWVKLGVKRARATGAKAIFWLNRERAHDANLISRVEALLPELDTEGLDLEILAPEQATRETCRRAKDGLDTISVTGNVLRDYLTDLFPILELGTSAKMLSIVPLLNGGGLYETGAGGSAPKHIQQFQEEGHLRWDSLGEFLALAVSIADLARANGNVEAEVLAESLDAATSRVLTDERSPLRKVGQLDNRGSHAYLALYWAEALANQDRAPALKETFAPVAASLAENIDTILAEIDATQGEAQDIGGYYDPDRAKASAAMVPSPTLKACLGM
jgi:isocitrate dehydrogenase